MSLFNLILLQAAPAGGSPFNGGFMIMMVLMFVVFWLFFIRPQQKKQKEEKNFRESLTKGDKVITIGGIYGRVVEVEENTILVEVDNAVKLRLEKGAIKSPAPGNDSKAKS